MFKGELFLAKQEPKKHTYSDTITKKRLLCYMLYYICYFKHVIYMLVFERGPSYII